jgi:4-amino-4-deoxy-L-arabinose transferase-like glycosyltransferase
MSPARAGSFPGAVALSVALTVALRAPFLATPLGVDEGGLAFVARHWVRHGTSVYGDQWLDRPPLLVLLVRVAVQAGGTTGLRLLGALAAGALVVVVAALARAIAGERAGRCAAVAAAVLASAVGLDAVYTPAELLAAVPACASVLCLVVALRGGRLRALVAAGALATAAALVKQSFLDAGVAGVVFLAACAAVRPARFRWTWPVAWAAGALLPVLAVLAASMAGYVDARALPYALLGFRLEALRTLAGTGGMFVVRFAGLLWPLVASGLAVALALVPAGLRRVPDPVVRATLLGWLAGGAVGVIGGGTYFAHYLIEVVPVSAALAGVAVAAMPAARRVALTRATVAAAGTLAVGAVAWVAAHQPHRVERAVGGYVRAHARPGDTAYVLYARANVLYYTGLPTPFPYDWSLMLRAQPDVRPALYRMLESPRRPTWIVTWQDDDRWRLDRDGIVDTLLARFYRPAATVDGHLVLHRVPPPTGT